MKKMFLAALVSSMLLASATDAANLMIDSKSKTYDPKAAITEINNSITAIGMVETETAKIAIRPFFHNFIMSGDTFFDAGLPYQKPKSMMLKTSGYVFTTTGKSFLDAAQAMAGVVLAVKNKKTDSPLVIDINNSALQIQDFYGQPFYAGQFTQQGKSTQPNFFVPPGQTKTVKLFRSDAKFDSTFAGRGVWAGWRLPVKPVDFNKIHAELTLKIDDKYVSITADGKIPDEIQKKYDQTTQMEAK